MPEHGDGEDDTELSPMAAAEEAAECTPRDHVRDGPVPLLDAKPRGPAPPRPVNDIVEPVATDAGRGKRKHEDNPPTAEADSDDDSQPERRWPYMDGARIAGPHRSDGRFASSSSSSDTTSANETDAAEGGAHSGSEHAADGANDDAAGSQDGSYTWSATSLILEANCLAHAREHFLALYRQQLSALEELTSREQGGRIGGMRRRLANKRWETVQAEARRLFQGEFLEQWRDYAFRSTHEYRPRNRPSERGD
eukprot:s3980_g5.t1